MKCRKQISLIIYMALYTCIFFLIFIGNMNIGNCDVRMSGWLFLNYIVHENLYMILEVFFQIEDLLYCNLERFFYRTCFRKKIH